MCASEGDSAASRACPAIHSPYPQPTFRSPRSAVYQRSASPWGQVKEELPRVTWQFHVLFFFKLCNLGSLTGSCVTLRVIVSRLSGLWGTVICVVVGFFGKSGPM